MTKVSIIGNNNNGQAVFDGGRIKIRLYQRLLQKSGVKCDIIELAGWSRHFLRVIKAIKRAAAAGDTILIMAGPRGCRMTIPLVNHLNRKRASRVVFCPLGIGALDSVVEGLSAENVSKFMSGEDDFGLKDESMKKQLEKLDLIIPQNDTITEAYRRFYGLSNVRLLPNFRDVDVQKRVHAPSEEFRVVFASRVAENKGILDLMNAVSSLRKDGSAIRLDVYGERQLTEEQKKTFDSLLGEGIAYHGTIAQAEMIQTLSSYDLFCLPTRYHGEGTPGALIEALIAGTPVLVSSYSQAKLLIDDGKTGVMFSLGDVDDLRAKLFHLSSHREEAERIGLAGQDSSSRFLFSSNKDLFLDCIVGGRK